MLVHEISTYEAWDNSILSDTHNEFQVGIYYGDGFRKFRWIVIDLADDGSLTGIINRPRQEEIVGYAEAWRTDDRSFKLAFPRQVLSKRLRVYKWTAASSFHDDRVAECSSDGEGHVISCIDRAPDGRLIRHEL